MNSTLLVAFDVLLAGLVLWVAWRALVTSDMFQGIVLFISFGLSMALVWIRLRAPDIALVEAAIGSGITGALLLAALGRMRPGDRNLAPPRVEVREGGQSLTAAPSRPAFGRALAPACLALAATLGWAIMSLPRGSAGLAESALGELGRSGVLNPVTAALLNYRAYDTLLELAVLLLAVVAVWAMAVADSPPADIPRGPVLHGLEHVLIPLMLVIGGYFLWIGTSRPGGAFQGGALLGGALVLLILAHASRRRLPAEWVGRWGFSLGLMVFLAVGLGVMGTGRLMLEYPPEGSGTWILLIETAAIVSIGLILAALFLGGRPREERESESAGEATPERT